MRTYYADGRRKRNDLYDHGRLLKDQYFGPEGELIEPHVPFRQPPIFPGGNEASIAYVQQNLRYPALTLRNAVEGRVLVTSTVTAGGTIAAVRVRESLAPELDEAALAGVRTLPAFDPGSLDGEPMPAPMLPISFKAPETTKFLRKLGF